MVPDLIDELVDKCRDLKDESVTTCFVQYVKLHERMSHYGRRTVETAQMIEEMNLTIVNFQKLFLKVFHVHQTLYMCLCSWC